MDGGMPQRGASCQSPPRSADALPDLLFPPSACGGTPPSHSCPEGRTGSGFSLILRPSCCWFCPGADIRNRSASRSLLCLNPTGRLLSLLHPLSTSLFASPAVELKLHNSAGCRLVSRQPSFSFLLLLPLLLARKGSSKAMSDELGQACGCLRVASEPGPAPRWLLAESRDPQPGSGVFLPPACLRDGLCAPRRCVRSPDSSDHVQKEANSFPQAHAGSSPQTLPFVEKGSGPADLKLRGL